MTVRWNLYTHGITQSQIVNWLLCRKKADLSLRELLSAQGEKEALVWGTLAHEVLDMLYTRIQEGKITPKQFNVGASVQAAVDKYMARYNDAHMAIEPNDLQTIEKCAEEVEILLRCYKEFWVDDLQQKRFVPVAVEKEFRLPVRVAGRIIPLRGKIDMVAKLNKGKPPLWIVEHKFRQRVDNSASDVISADFQVQFYLFVVRSLFQERPGGVLYNVTRRPLLRQKKNESPSTFANRIRKDVQDRPEHYFFRWQVQAEVDDMQDFRKELLAILEEIVEWYEGRRRSFKNTAGCTSPYRCQFIPVCHQNDSSGFDVRDKIFPELS